MEPQNSFEKIAKIVLYVVAGFLPLWFLPLPTGVELGREITFSILIIAALVLWLLSVLTTGELRFQISPVLYAAGHFLAVMIISTFLSVAPSVSAFLADPVGEKLSTLILGVFLMFLMGGLFKKQKEVGTLVFVLIFAGGVSALVNLAQLLTQIPLYQKLFSFAQGADFNAIGTQNGLALFFATLLAVALGVITSASFKKWKGWVRTALLVSILAFLANLVVINFWTSWIVVLAVAVFLFGLISKNAFRARNTDSEANHSEARGRKFDWRSWITLLLLTVSVVMLLVRSPIIKTVDLPTEVSPSLQGTLQIGLRVFKEGARQLFFGSGPGTFGLDWGKYKDPSINQTVFWSLRFNQGSSWLTTMVPTTGILGALAFLAFLLACLFSFLKQLFLPQEKEETALSAGLFLGFVSLVLTSVLYPSNLSIVLLFFLVVGLISAYLCTAKKETADEESNFWEIMEKKISFSSPWAVFLSSLFVIFFIALGVTGLYLETGKIRSALALQEGTTLLSAGKLDEAVAEFENMAVLDADNFRNYQLLVQVRMEKIKNLIQRASANENVQQDFQSSISQAIQDAQKAIQLYPVEPSLWRLQGSLYELIIPFIQGSERFAFSSYQQAVALDPFNPSIWIDLGRAGLTYADRLQSLKNQATAAEKDQLDKLHTTVLQETEKAFQKAAEIKQDYAPAHFLMAQTALRLGNMQSAIRSTENAKLAAPFDIGIAFQLGLLYYQNNNLNQAQAEFERALYLNPSYSNARYFLGLVYDRKGNTKGAVEQFQQVLALNPDNQEIKNILANLQKDKPALAGIVPPGTPPEKRSTAPVEEKGKNSSNLRKK